jgi:hypothetical protein
MLACARLSAINTGVNSCNEVRLPESPEYSELGHDQRTLFTAVERRRHPNLGIFGNSEYQTVFR